MLGKLFNKNQMKISYSCLPNISAKIGAHNRSLVRKKFEENNALEKSCNCQASRTCPLKGNCVVEDVIYQGELLKEGQAEGEGQLYLGLASGSFKKRLANPNQSFRDGSKRKISKLYEAVWDLKDRGIHEFKVEWSIIAHETGFNKKTRKCQLCLREKVEILKALVKHTERVLNKRQELYRRCLYRRKHFLGDLSENIVLTNDNQEDHNFIPTEEIREGIPFWQTRSGNNWRERVGS